MGNGADDMIHMVGGHRPQGAAPLQAGHRVRPGGWFPYLAPEPRPLPGPRLPEYSLCIHSPSVQFLESSRVPLQSRPPFWGGGAMHSRLRQWAHSVLQADHLLHSVHAPSTVGAQHIAHGNTHVQTHTHAGMCTEHSNVPRRPHRELHTISKHPTQMQGQVFQGGKENTGRCIRSLTQMQPHAQMYTQHKPRVKTPHHLHKHVTKEQAHSQTCKDTEAAMQSQTKTKGEGACCRIRVSGQGAPDRQV